MQTECARGSRSRSARGFTRSRPCRASNSRRTGNRRTKGRCRPKSDPPKPEGAPANPAPAEGATAKNAPAAPPALPGDLAALLNPDQAPAAPLPDVVATVEGQDIKKEEIEQALIAALGRQGIPAEQMPAGQKAQGYKMLLNDLITEKLVTKRAASVEVKEIRIVRRVFLLCRFRVRWRTRGRHPWRATPKPLVSENLFDHTRLLDHCNDPHPVLAVRTLQRIGVPHLQDHIPPFPGR